jgi:quinolinate synthase
MPIHESTLEKTLQAMRAKLGALVPDVEIKYKAELVFEINKLKVERNAILLGHNYMEPALYHTVPDVVGDSLQLSKKAAEVTNPIIVFCGVRFMAETAKILNPDKLVLLPAKIAGCSLASSITAADVRALKARYPGVPVVTYINTYADVKAETDICCTSGNASKIVASLPGDSVIFLPDEYLAANVAKETGKTIIYPDNLSSVSAASKESPFQILGWRGRCEVHDQFSVEDVLNARKQFPNVVIMAHPECSPAVVAECDFSGSTSTMVNFVAKQEPKSQFLLLTECSMADNIAADNPDKEFLSMCSIRCPHMNEITLEDVLESLQNLTQEITVPEDIRVRAKKSLDRMLDFS